ncbi:hypothetical protein ACOSHH_004949 [Klebsiella aerogenes]
MLLRNFKFFLSANIALLFFLISTAVHANLDMEFISSSGGVTQYRVTGTWPNKSENQTYGPGMAPRAQWTIGLFQNGVNKGRVNGIKYYQWQAGNSYYINAYSVTVDVLEAGDILTVNDSDINSGGDFQLCPYDLLWSAAKFCTNENPIEPPQNNTECNFSTSNINIDHGSISEGDLNNHSKSVSTNLNCTGDAAVSLKIIDSLHGESAKIVLSDNLFSDFKLNNIVVDKYGVEFNLKKDTPFTLTVNSILKTIGNVESGDYTGNGILIVEIL